MSEERTVVKLLNSQLYSVEALTGGYVIAAYICTVIDSQGNKCHCDGYDLTHKHFDEIYGRTITPLTWFYEWRD